jgi:hypothetical protein
MAQGQADHQLLRPLPDRVGREVRRDGHHARGRTPLTVPHPAQRHRERLAHRYAELPTPRIGHTLLKYPIGSDRELAERLASEQVVTGDDLLDAILGQRNAILEQLGPLLLQLGVAPDAIAAMAGVTLPRIGPESATHAQTFKYFESLAQRVPSLMPVARAFTAQQAEHQQRTTEHKRQERLRGR